MGDLRQWIVFAKDTGEIVRVVECAEHMVTMTGQWSNQYDYVSWHSILAENSRLREALEWYGMEQLYNMTEFMTASPVREVGVPSNIVIQGSPIMHDKGKRARDALSHKTPLLSTE